MMSSRQRLLHMMQGKPVDRTPVAPFVYGNVVREWKSDANADLISRTIEFCKAYQFDIILRNFNIRADAFSVSTPQWQVTRRTEQQAPTVSVTVTEIETPGGTLRQADSVTRLTAFHTVAACTEFLIKTEEDFELLLRYRPPCAPPQLDELRRAKSAIGGDGILAPWTWGVFNYMAQFRSLDDLLTDPYLNPEFYARFAEYALHRLKAELEPVLREGVDMLSYTGNIANGSLAGPAFFERFVLPYEKQLIDFIQVRCTGVIYHNCGDGANMLGCYNELLPCCYESMTEPPYADNSFALCMNRLSQKITLMGNLDQITFLREAAPAQVRQKAEELLRDAACHPRFILGTSDFLEEGTPPENLRALTGLIGSLDASTGGAVPK